MLTLTAIIVLIVLGLALLVVEVIFVPGTTLVGIVGVAFAGLGVLLGFLAFGTEVGIWLLIGTAVAGVLAVVISVRNRSWQDFSLKSAIDSKVNEEEVLVPVGARGITTSALRPSGKADFNGQEFEVRTRGNHLETGKEVRVFKLEGKTIYVEPLTTYQ